MALHELSESVGRLEPRHPLRHLIALHRKAKLILVRMYVIASGYDSAFFSAILLASIFIVRIAEGHAPPYRKTREEPEENTRGTLLVDRRLRALRW